jgi:hypothetical protein
MKMEEISQGVSELDGYRQNPHIVVQTGDEEAKKVHVIPLSFIQDVISGDRQWSDMEDGDAILRRILTEWIDRMPRG